MTPADAAAAVAPPISDFGSRFMLDPGFYVGAAAEGFEGLDFYVVGRGGVLGDVDADVVSAAFGFFEPSAVRAMWERGSKVMAPADAAVHFSDGCAQWCRDRFTADIDYSAVTELGGRIIDAAPIAGMALFAAWKAVERPSDPKGSAGLTLHILRELRGGAHVIGEMATGLDPLSTVLVKGGIGTARMLGWQPPFPDVGDCTEAWEQGERITNAIVATAFVALDEADRDRFVELVTALHAGIV